MEHSIKRIDGGEGYTGWTQSVCSCGWESRKEYNYGNYQHSNLKEAENAHKRKANEST